QKPVPRQPPTLPQARFGGGRMEKDATGYPSLHCITGSRTPAQDVPRQPPTPLEPKPDQGQALARMAGARRFIWNWGLVRWKAHYQATGKSISLKQLSAELTALKQQPET